MKKHINILSAVFFSSHPVLLAIFLAIIVRYSFGMKTGLMIGGVLLIISIRISMYIYKEIRKTGAIKLLVVNHASPELDDLMPVDYLDEKEESFIEN